MSELQSFLQSTLTCKELLEELKHMPPDAPVFVSTNYGDRAMTQQLHSITINDVGEHTTGDIEETAYSTSGFAIGGQNGDGTPVVIINL